jgi:NO-binding membrane sensor protein with MHYT domain
MVCVSCATPSDLLTYYRVQVGGCAVSFGLVAIWCMHFVGNRAIVLGDGEAEIQLYYSPTYTAVSAILPVVVIFLGLLVADRFYKGSKRAITRFASLLVCGICAGAAVTEMHYLGNNGTTNYRLHLSWPHVFGAASIAVGACLISFGLFFHWSKHWMNNIWRRTIVACFLAIAVSGMHWTAAAGTWYEIRGYHHAQGQERNVNLIISLSLVSHTLLNIPFSANRSVFECMCCLLSTRIYEATSAKVDEGPRAAGRTCDSHFRCRRKITCQPKRSDALPDHHPAIPSKGELTDQYRTTSPG